MFLGQLSALEEFTNIDSTEAQEIVEKFRASVKELINCKASDASVDLMLHLFSCHINICC